MFSDNDQISSRQLKRMIIIETAGISSLIVPHIAAGTSGKDGMIAIVAGILGAILYALLVTKVTGNVKTSYFSYLKSRCGKTGACGIVIFYLFQAVILGAFALRLLGEVISQCLLSEVPMWLILLLVVLISGYAAVNGIECRARMVEILFFIVLVPVVIMLVFSSPEIHLPYLFPLFVNPAGNILKGAYGVLIPFSFIGLMSFLLPYVKEKKELRKSTVWGIGITGILNLGVFVLCLGAFGSSGIGALRWPVVSLMTIVKVPGGILARWDSLIVSMWIISIITWISACIFYGGLMLKQLTGGRRLIGYLPVYMAVIFMLALFPDNYLKAYDMYALFMACAGIPLTILILLLLLILEFFHSRSQIKQDIQK